FRFRRQQPIGPYIADFVCVEAHLIVELDGSQHLDSSDDVVRDAGLREEGFCIVRFWNDVVLLRTDEVLSAILSALVSGVG
ncbi:MAG: endonuclease domain-containing protein, partial [Lysobacterales bacterium]